MPAVISASKLARLAVPPVALAASAHLVPGVLVLGQWWPGWLAAPDVLPGRATRWRGPADGRNHVALTFDDGPDPDGTPRILAALDRHGLVGTFFCLGAQAVQYPEIVKEIVGRGHEVGVHGYRHRHHLLSTGPAIRRDLDEAVAVLTGITGEPVRFFRPPYGQVSGGSLWAARRIGLELVLWSAWGREWADRDPVSVAERIARRLRPGSIVLLHDSDACAPAGKAAVTESALSLVAGLIGQRGLQAVTLTGLLHDPGVLAASRRAHAPRS